jgi:hypothetical protein
MGRVSDLISHRGTKMVGVQVRRFRSPNDGMLPDSEDVLVAQVEEIVMRL